MWTTYGLILYFCIMATIKYFIQSKNNPAGIYVRLKEGRNIDAKAKTKFAAAFPSPVLSMTWMRKS